VELFFGLKMCALSDFQVKMGCCHQGQLCSSKLYNKIGVFDTSYKIDMDYDFLLRAYREGVTSLAINLPISVMRLNGVSSKTDWPSLRKRFSEELHIHKKYCIYNWMHILYCIYWKIYLPYRKIISLAKSYH